jgi:hypothetical protein
MAPPAVLRQLVTHLAPQPSHAASTSATVEEAGARPWGDGSTARTPAGQLASVPYTEELPGCRDTEVSPTEVAFFKANGCDFFGLLGAFPVDFWG